MLVTKVTYTKKFEKQLKKVPEYIRQKVRLWVFNIELQGLRKVREGKGYHDEPLLGARWGQRSVRLNKAYRLIYKTISDEVQIELIEVHKHDY